jgi:undecaprenyl-diphosphatase
MNKKRLLIVGLGIFFLFSFYIFSREIKHGFLKQTDFNVIVILQDHMPVRLDGLWEAIALPVTPAPSVVIVGLITLIAFSNKRVRFRAVLIPILFGLLVLGELYGKSVVHHPAPPFFMIKNPTTIFPQFYINEQYSYPSGHTSRAVFLGITLFSIIAGPIAGWMKQRKKLFITGGLIVAYMAAVALGRIYLDHHWLSDVIGGGLLGSGLGLLIPAIY